MASSGWNNAVATDLALRKAKQPTNPMAGAEKPKAGRSKYGAVKVTIDGVTFDSKAEARRYAELKLMEKAGEIYGLELQPEFPLMVPGRGPGGPYERVCLGKYIADFRYRLGRRGLLTIEDVKGFDYPLGRWKRRHCEAQYGIQVRLIK